MVGFFLGLVFVYIGYRFVGVFGFCWSFFNWLFLLFLDIFFMLVDCVCDEGCKFGKLNVVVKYIGDG